MALPDVPELYEAGGLVEEPSTPTAGSGPGPFSAFAGSHADLTTAPHEAAAAAFAAHGACGGGAGLGGCAWAAERQRLRAATRSSGEGALEGFADPQVGVGEGLGGRRGRG